MRLLKISIPLLTCVLLTACQTAPAPKGEKVVSPPTAGGGAMVKEEWVRSEIYCGFAPLEAEGLGLAAAEGTWRTFLDEEVTPRFPDGLSVFDAYGQWRENTDAPIARMRSKVLVIVYPDSAARRAGVNAICEAYKKRTGEKSVLVVTTPVTAEAR
jgi:hypothetical protein